jgi:hypothetical protein
VIIVIAGVIIVIAGVIIVIAGVIIVIAGVITLGANRHYRLRRASCLAESTHAQTATIRGRLLGAAQLLLEALDPVDGRGIDAAGGRQLQ